MIKLKLPLDVDKYPISQWFGVPASPVTAKFYKELGLAGHNGIDFICRQGTEIKACHDGDVIVGNWSDGNKYVWIVNKTQKIKTMYCHLSAHKVKTGDKVKAGDVIALSGNTGKYTTGAHLHLGLYLIDANGNYTEYNNGYDGAVDPAPYLAETIEDGTMIKYELDPAVFIVRNQKRYWILNERSFEVAFGVKVGQAKIKKVNLITLNNIPYDGLISVSVVEKN